VFAAGHVDLCNAPIPVREQHGEKSGAQK